MAKGKHSTALFEVIHSGKQPEQAAQRLRTPKWWFKGRTAGPEPQPEAPATAVAEIENDPTARALPAPPPPPALRSPSSYSMSGRSSVVHFTFDRDRHEITLRLRYTTAIVSTFFMFVVVAMAYVLGRHISRGPQMALASEQPLTEQIRRQAPQQGVTDVPQRTHPKGNVSANLSGETSRRTTETSPMHPQNPPAPPPAPPGVERGLPRSVNLNYVIIQSYPKDAKIAQQAKDFLEQHGIHCTLEHTGYTLPNWVSVVGTEGFVKISSKEYDSYVTRINELSKEFAGSRFSRFEPRAYKWREE